MKIATYNVWNSEMGMPERLFHIIEEITSVKADIVCLQEVRDEDMSNEIAEKTGYSYCFFGKYADQEEGLCVLSNTPFINCELIQNAYALYCSLLYNDNVISVVNLHLPWDSVIQREQQIVEIIRKTAKKQSDYYFIAGDFNCNDSSDIQRFLTGECLLNGEEANPRWYDLASAYAELTNSTPSVTLNFRNNPRFKNNTIELNGRYDRILLRNTYPNEFPVLKSCYIFGTKIYENNGLSASDHYGLVIDVE